MRYYNYIILKISAYKRSKLTNLATLSGTISSATQCSSSQIVTVSASPPRSTSPRDLDSPARYVYVSPSPR